MSNSAYVVSIALGFLLPTTFFFLAAYRVRRSARLAENLFFGDRHLSSGDIRQSLVASWMSVGNVVVGAIIIVFTYGAYSLWAVASWILGFLVLRNHATAI